MSDQRDVAGLVPSGAGIREFFAQEMCVKPVGAVFGQARQAYVFFRSLMRILTPERAAYVSRRSYPACVTLSGIFSCPAKYGAIKRMVPIGLGGTYGKARTLRAGL